jgi:hypothetical protein
VKTHQSWWTIRVEFVLRDFWVGAYWKRVLIVSGPVWRFDLYVCLIPCFPIHFRSQWPAARKEAK